MPYIVGMETRNPMYPQFSPGQKVTTIFGETRTVLAQVDCQVFVLEEPHGWYHPSKVFPKQAAQ
jgi:hypothetical protein